MLAGHANAIGEPLPIRHLLGVCRDGQSTLNLWTFAFIYSDYYKYLVLNNVIWHKPNIPDTALVRKKT